MSRPKPPSAKEYQRARVNEALSYAPDIRPCKKCGWPVVSGYCCNYCGTSSPTTTDEEDSDA